LQKSLKKQEGLQYISGFDYTRSFRLHRYMRRKVFKGFIFLTVFESSTTYTIPNF
jgi:hypothetical protein